jgi:SprB repeat/Secretion system C-terminal sorting domain
MKKITFLISGLLSVLTIKSQSTCATATVVTPGTFNSGVLTGAGASQPDATNSAWYSFTPASSGILSINSCGGGADTRLWITSGTCATQVAVADNDDAPSCISTGAFNYGSRLENVILLAGNTYYIEWDDVYTTAAFNWSFTFTALPSNNDAAVVSYINQYTSLPISQITPVALGGAIKNLNANALTNVVLTANIFATSNLITPIASFSSPAASLPIAATINAVCGTWTPPSNVASYVIQYVNTQTEIDAVPTNNNLSLNFDVDFNFYRRDNNITAGSLGLAAGNIRQGNVFTVVTNDNITGVSAYIGTTSVGQTYTAEIYAVTAGVVGAAALYTSPAQTTTGVAGFVNVNFPALAVTPGEYLAVIHHTSIPASVPASVNIGIGTSSAIITATKSKLRIAAGAWLNIEAATAPAMYQVRVKFGIDPPFDLRFVSNVAPQGEYTAVHERQSTAGNILNFSATAKNFGTSPSTNARMILTVYGPTNAVVYTATSTSQTLAANATSTFTVASFTAIVEQTYRVEYNFVSDDIDNVPNNNKSETTFKRNANYMSRSNASTSSVGIGPNATVGVYDNAVIGQTFTLTNPDRLDSVRFQLAAPPAGVPVRVDIYNTTAAGVPTGTPIASTSIYTLTASDNLNGVTLKLPITTPLSLAAGTYFFGVIEEAGNITLASSPTIYTIDKAFLKWDAVAGGAWNEVGGFGAAFQVAFVIEPIFKTCLPITATATATNASCTAADGGASLVVSGGTAPYTYLWSNGQPTANLTGVNNGVFTVTITDANTCTKNASVTVQNISTLLASATATNTACAAATNGSVTVVPTLGTVPYTYTWTGSPVTTATRTNLPAGSYTCTVGDAAGCEYVVIQTITAGTTDLTATATTVNTSCASVNNGSLTINPTLGVSPYTYSWTGSPITIANRINLPVGPYTCTVTDALGCSFAITQNINAGTSTLAATITATNVLCFGAPTGSIATVATLGTAPYTYSWTGSPSTTASISAVAAGSYTCTVTDAIGCTFVSNAVTVTQPTAALTVTGAVNNLASTINATPAGGTAPYTYTWTNGAITQDLTDSVANGSYTLTVTDANGCLANGTYVVANTVGLEEITGLQNLNIFPNPSNGTFTVAIQLAVSSDVKVELLNNLGQVLVSKSAQTTSQSFEFANTAIAAGTYVIRTSVNAQSTSRLITIQ